MSPEEKAFRSGFATIIGRPNVGKSTLLNHLVGEKIAIISDKPQTTRNRIQAVLNRPGAQLVLVDTPGIHKPQHRLGELMVRLARHSLEGVDVIVFVVEAPKPPGRGDEFIANWLKDVSTPVVLFLNKAENLSAAAVEKARIDYGRLHPFEAVVPGSALTGMGTGDLVVRLVEVLPEGPQYFPDDMLTDQPEQLVMAELIREKILHLTREEIPHSVAVEIESMAERENGKLYVGALIYVERDSQKGIIIGKRGRMLREVGARARADIEALLGSPIYLELWVKVKDDWRNREGALHQLGYRLDE